ncbi:MAG: peptidylprolyl isomerase [Azoarcus sp.]|jgi:peptidyl-prolyl cis-trans isomerase C|nr:peptidylprolyl isomerase [Azoarcus sp.]
MKTRTLAAATLFAAAFVSAAVAAEGKGAVYITVNGVEIPQATVDAIVAEQKMRGAPTDDPEFQKQVREEMIGLAVMVSEAKKLGLDKTPGYKTQMEIASQQILSRGAVNDYASKHPATDAEIRAEYDRINAAMGSTQYKLRHIEYKTEDAAKAAIAKFGKGVKFDKLVAESSDTEAKKSGGDFGWGSLSQLPQPVAEVVKQLKKGEVNKTPYKGQDSWHIFLLENTRPYTPPKFEEVKDSLADGIVQQKTAKYFGELRQQATIK